MSTEPPADDYAISKGSEARVFAAPDLEYKPRDPKSYHPAIGCIACGGITEHHMGAYHDAGYNVVMLCDQVESRARKRRDQFFPNAQITTNYHELLSRPDIEVVDIATHPPERWPIIEDALNAGKHVLSQKPFVLDLAVGERLVRLAQSKGLKLAVNQNGRWAPHFSYMRAAVKAGVLGDLISAHFGVHWDHSWTAGTPFEAIPDLVLYDFAIHWFDICAHLLAGRKITRVQAFRGASIDQVTAPPLLAEVIAQYEGGQASLVFDAGVKYGPLDHTYLAGTKGTIFSVGPDLGTQVLTLSTEQGTATPKLEGAWFDQGFHGTMAELLCSIEDDREPINSARENLNSLAFCFAAIASAHEGTPKVPGEVRKLPPGSAPERTIAVPDKEDEV